MSNIDTALYTRLAGFAGVSGVVSSRIYPPPVPQNGTYPMLTFQQISGVRDYVMGNQTGLCECRYQVDSWAETSVAARTLSIQVRLALSNWHGTSDSIVVNWIRMDGEEKVYESETELHRVTQDYMITFWEALP